MEVRRATLHQRLRNCQFDLRIALSMTSASPTGHVRCRKREKGSGVPLAQPSGQDLVIYLIADREKNQQLR
jgi:hypothetical protein